MWLELQVAILKYQNEIISNRVLYLQTAASVVESSLFLQKTP